MSVVEPPQDAPVIYRRLMDLACDQPRRDIEKELVDAARRSADKVNQLVYKAYQEGLRDGYVEGVQASVADAMRQDQT